MVYFDEEKQELDEEIFTVGDEALSEYDKKRRSCSFTGHRNLTEEEQKNLVVKLHTTIQYLISLGVKEFHVGGAIGFDTLAGMVVCQLKKLDADVKLILETPYEDQVGKKWTEKQVRHYKFVFDNADEVFCHSENPKNYWESKQALLKRNSIMIDKSYYCVCFLRDENAKGGTAYTVKYAKKQGAHIINLAE